jgi:hypothetical protein
MLWNGKLGRRNIYLKINQEKSVRLRNGELSEEKLARTHVTLTGNRTTLQGLYSSCFEAVDHTAVSRAGTALSHSSTWYCTAVAAAALAVLHTDDDESIRDLPPAPHGS